MSSIKSLLFRLLNIFFLFISLKTVTSFDVICEKALTYEWKFAGRHFTCDMKTKVTIDTNDFEILNINDDITGLNFDHNKNIEFLPVEFGRNFESLEALSAFGCSIKTIIKANFAHLSQLKYLSLEKNKIERINSDTFEDLEGLEHLRLGKLNVFLFFSQFF
jgi:uncharacterized protein YjiK